MAATVAAPTPASEKNTITASDGADAGADVARQPSVAAGAQPAGILQNKAQRPSIANDGPLSSGYAADSDTETEARTARKNVKSVNAAAASPNPTSPNMVNGQTETTTNANGAQFHTQSSPAYTHSDPSRRHNDYNENSPSLYLPKAPPSVMQENVNGQGQDSSKSQNRRSVTGAFAAGAALTGPAAIPEPDITQHQRTATAESSLPNEARAKIAKAEQKDAKRMSKLITQEGKAQQKNLDVAVKELTRLQKVQKQASSDESRALSKHSKAAKVEHKLHSKYLKAKAKHESAVADLRAAVDHLEMSRTHAQRETEMLSAKTKEVEELRRAKAVDDREREAKLAQLKVVGKH